MWYINKTQPTSLNQIIDESKKHPVIIFKHSATCPISAGAYSRMTQGVEQGLVSYPVYTVIVQEDRELSNQIAESLEIQHASPQLLLVKDGKVVYDASHGNIQVDAIPKLS